MHPNSVKNLRPRKPGEPPPPGAGRPKGYDGMARHIRGLFGEDGNKIVAEFKRIAMGAKTERDRLTALQWLSDHGYGKAPDTIHLGGEEDGAPIRQQDVKPLVSDEAALRILRPTEPPANAV